MLILKATITESKEEQTLQVEFDNGVCVYYYLPALIDSSPGSFHPQTHERCFDLLSIPDTLSPSGVEVQDAGQSLCVQWVDISGAGQCSTIPAQWLYDCRPGAVRPDAVEEVQPVLWRGGFCPPVHQAQQILADDAALLRWLVDIRRYGLTLVEGMEKVSADNAVNVNVTANDSTPCALVARRIGFLRETNFGRLFNVITEPNPNNLAYTSLELPLHTDLPNQEMPPGLQFLHCIANEAQGGESTFADGFCLVDTLRGQSPVAFDALSSIPVPYRFHDAETDIRVRRTVIQTNSTGQVTELRYNAHILDAIDLAFDNQKRWYPAYKQLMALTRAPSLRIAFKMQAGQMVCFDNRRVLHGRAAFNPQTGQRRLQGCYVDRGEFESRLRVLHSRGF